MLLDNDAYFRAVRARDRRFDGRFFVGIASTRIYCRPICPARPAKRENMSFYKSAAAAEAKGFRPCLRCRPERAPHSSPIDAVSRRVGAVVAGIERHALSSERVGELAASLGVSDRHLRRITELELGVSPIELAQTYRLLLAKRLLRDTTLNQTQIAFASGFASVRRFNALFKTRYGLSPRDLRGKANTVMTANALFPPDTGVRVELEFRPPFAWDCCLSYLKLRGIPGVESVDATHYRRTVSLGESAGWIAVSMHESRHALQLEMSASLAPVIGAVIAQVKQLFDLGAYPDAVSAQLSQDPMLKNIVGQIPGLRVPGCFDGFEVAVRVILGQQVSVKGASTLAGRWAKDFGASVETPYPELDRLTPSVENMAKANLSAITSLGIVGNRAKSIIALAHALLTREITLAYVADVEAEIDALERVPGIGPWTAQYIAMRALSWPDAFPSGDLVLLKSSRLTEKTLRTRAEAWRPWRAYAAHYLWQLA